MNSVLFVCTGNINRSPAGEIILTALAAQHGLTLTVASAGTSSTQQGKLMAKKMRDALTELGYTVPELRSQPVTQSLLDAADVVLCMAPNHLKRLQAFHTGNKLKLLGLLLAPPQKTIDDPHFHGGHLDVAKQIEFACERFVQRLISEREGT